MAVSMAFMQEELDRMKQEGLYGKIRTLTGPQGAWIEIDGKKYLNLCSNNYLGLANDPRVRAKTKETIDRYGIGPGAVRTIGAVTRSGWRPTPAQARFIALLEEVARETENAQTSEN